MPILVCGSLAFDTIMTFEGRFADQILPDQLHILNVSFLVPSLRRDFGGCAGNIAYSLKLLGGEPLPMAMLGSDGADYLQRLESLGLKVLAMEPKSSADAQRVMGKLGQLLEVPDAERIWRAIDAGVMAAAQSLPASARSLRVYYEVSTGGYAAGTQSFIGEMMARLGVQNILTPDLGPFPRINPEYVVRANPDLIMIGQRNVAGLAQRPGWQGMRALREGRAWRSLRPVHVPEGGK